MVWAVIGVAVAIAIAAIAWLLRTNGRRWPSGFALVVAGGGIVLITNAPQAVIVRDAAAGGGLAIETATMLGTPDGAGPDCRPRHTWVMNHSHRAVRVIEVDYGHQLVQGAQPSQPVEIRPGAACSTNTIDYVGPDHPPPEEVPLVGDEARLKSGTRTWLTW